MYMQRRVQSHLQSHHLTACHLQALQIVKNLKVALATLMATFQKLGKVSKIALRAFSPLFSTAERKNRRVLLLAVLAVLLAKAAQANF